MTKKVFTIKLGSGETAKRTSTRDYTYGVVAETTEAQKADAIAMAEGYLAEAEASVATLVPEAAKPEAQAAHARAVELRDYWDEKVPHRDGTAERWLAFPSLPSTYPRWEDGEQVAPPITQADPDTHYSLLREQVEQGLIPESLHASIARTPTVAQVTGYNPKGKAVGGLTITHAINHDFFGSAVSKLGAAQDQLKRAKQNLASQKKRPVGAKSQVVLGWSQTLHNAQKRVSSGLAHTPLARIFLLEPEVRVVKPRKKAKA